MKALRLLLIAAIILLPLSAALAGPETLADFKVIYDAELMKIGDVNMAEMAQVHQAYSNYLDAESKKATNAGDFKTFEKIEQEKKRFEQERTIPADSPFQQLAARIESKRNAAINDLSIRYVSGIKTHQMSLMKAKDIDGSRAVQQEIDRVQASITEYAAKLSAAIPKKEIVTGTSPDKLNLTKPAAITVSYNNTELLVGNSAYKNYQYLLTETPKELKGYFFTQQVKRTEAAVQFEVTDGGIVYCLYYNPPDNEWKETGWTVGINYNGNVAKINVYKKALIKGIYSLPKGAWLIFPKK
jgi:hypothetical protein